MACKAERSLFGSLPDSQRSTICCSSSRMWSMEPAIPPAKPQPPKGQIEQFLEKDLSAKAKLRECHIKPELDGRDMKMMAVDPVMLPLIKAFAKPGFDRIMDQQARSLDDLKQRSVQTYGTTVFMQSQDLRIWSCLGVARITRNHPNKGDSHLGMLALPCTAMKDLPN